MVRSIKKKLRNAALCLLVFEAALFVYLKEPARGEETTPVQHLVGETMDFSGKYRIIRFYQFDGIKEDFQFSDVTVATQCSINHLHHLVELLNRWDGPVSCAVFAPNQDTSFAVDAIALMRRCFPKIRQHVIFHLVYPSAHQGDLSQMGSWMSLSCADLLLHLENYGYQNYDVSGLSFPHNVLRNVARSGVLTQYVLLLDIDVMPNLHLRHQFLDFAQRMSLFDVDVTDMMAYVLPVFEVKAGSKFPENKKELLEGMDAGIIRPFHNETCWWCHLPENVDRWSKEPQSALLEVAFTAEWDKSWEPFYIARREVPMFDGRFMQYGFDRIQQVCEMYVAGYAFGIMNPAFLTHRGWKLAGRFYAGKERDNAQNWVLFNYHFKDHLPSKYGSNKSCSPTHNPSAQVKRFSLRGGRGVVNSLFNNRGRK